MIVFSEKNWGEYIMDKISAILIFCIAGLLFTSGFIFYRTWLADGAEMTRMETVTECGVPDEELRFNDDTSITCNSDSRLWIRVKITNVSEEEDLMKLYDAVDEEGWKEASGWLYCKRSLGMGETTHPVIQNDKKLENFEKKQFRLKIEAIDEDWLFRKPYNGMEAFMILEDMKEEKLSRYI